MTPLWLRRAAVSCALLGSPALAGAAPITVTYEITGGMGSPFGMDGVSIVSGMIVVTFPNPGSGGPPLHTAAHSIRVDFEYEYGGSPGVFQRTFRPATFFLGTAYRGTSKTLTASRGRFYCQGGPTTPYGCPHPGRTGQELFRIRAGADGQIISARWRQQSTTEATANYWWRIIGREVDSAPEPASSLLLAFGGAALSGAGAAARYLRRG